VPLDRPRGRCSGISAFSHAWKSHRRDRTGWLPWKDSNRSASISNRSTRIIQSNRTANQITRARARRRHQSVSVMAPRERTAGNENPKLEYCGPNQRSDTRSLAPRLSLKASINASPVAARAQRAATNIAGLARTTPPCGRGSCVRVSPVHTRQDGLQSSSTAEWAGNLAEHIRGRGWSPEPPSTWLWIALTSKRAAVPRRKRGPSTNGTPHADITGEIDNGSDCNSLR